MMSVRWSVSALALLAGAAVPSLAAAQDCAAEVTAAFEKQRTSRAFRMVADTKGDPGPVKLQIDYVTPDRMYQSVRHPSHPEPIETIAIGRWAWGTMGGGWEELQPQFAQSVTAHVRQALAEPIKQSGPFDCLGKVVLDGKEYVGYRSKDAGAPAAAGDPPILHRTVYVDPVSGLPMLNIVAERKDGAEPVFKGVFSYPTDIKVEAPIGDPDPK